MATTRVISYSEIDTDTAWLAGLLEGEGSFWLHRRKDRAPVPEVQVAMCDRDVIERASALMGGNRIEVREPSNPLHSTRYATRLRGHPALELMKKLRPLMGARRMGQIDRCLDSEYARTARARKAA